MKIKFRKVRLSNPNITRLGLINTIIEEYQKQGYKLTLRQLYYQLVSRDVISNKQSEYSKLSTLLKEGRMGGIVDWEAIEDRLRIPYKPASFDSPGDILDACIKQYALPRMGGQNKYLEVWVEKDAISGVLKRVTSKYHVPILVNRGYSSASAMFDSYERFREALENKQEIILIYLGDFDPSGLDMIRDIQDRTLEFLLNSDLVRDIDVADEYDHLIDLYERDDDCQVEEDGQWYFFAEKAWIKDRFRVIPVALTKSQIEEYNPPPNPAKITDPRAKDFIKIHGNKSWEVDALRPEVLNQLLEDAIVSNIDIDKFQNIRKQEKIDKKKLKELKKQI